MSSRGKYQDKLSTNTFRLETETQFLMIKRRKSRRSLQRWVGEGENICLVFVWLSVH